MTTSVGPDAEAPTGPGRHEARERAIALLYERELRALDARELLDSLPLEPDRYASEALVGIAENATRIDSLIDEHASRWSLSRLPHLDRAILRLAVWELTSRPEVPTAVVIDEAVELAKEYSTERSAGFVNGVLDTVAALARPA